MLSPLLLFCLALLAGALLACAAQPAEPQTPGLVEQIDTLLPQTQCGQCGHPGCKPYAAAIAEGAAINKCPPGGRQTIARLASLLNRAVVPLDPQHGAEGPRRVAFIREAECIGCTKCLQACPVDAIVGAAKLMHTVISAECTGCDLCVEPCPVDCIDLLPVPSPWQPVTVIESPARGSPLIGSERGRGLAT